MKKLFLILLIGFLANVLTAQNNVLFEEATKLYNEGDYESAIEKYTTILASGEHSAALYYNLGNAHYKLNRIGPSIYFYEKALLLAPNDEDVKNNLAFAKNMTIDVIEPLPQTGFSKLIEKSIGKLSYNQWAITAVIFVFVFILLFLLYYFFNKQQLKRLFFVTSLITVFLAVIAIIMAFQEYNVYKNNRPAIVFAQEVGIKSEPNDRSEEIFSLHEGAKVTVLEELNDWKKIRLADGKVGWVPQQEIKELKIN
ncbi:SH3 domain-containing protein [Leptobacterium sp. I13]|uniref:SH3 domain-containing protein n=1 Tax=Leptobacterium meishanense TaxID=3128904 RepID=UPI0030EC8223